MDGLVIYVLSNNARLPALHVHTCTLYSRDSSLRWSINGEVIVGNHGPWEPFQALSALVHHTLLCCLFPWGNGKNSTCSFSKMHHSHSTAVTLNAQACIQQHANYIVVTFTLSRVMSMLVGIFHSVPTLLFCPRWNKECHAMFCV